MVLKTYETHAKNPPIDDDSDINENVEATSNKNKQFEENYFIQACMKDPKLCETMISFSPQEFHNFVDEHSFLLDQFTERGTVCKRVKRQETKYFKPFEIFITLLWLRQYPIFSFLQAIFNVHQRSIQQIVKKTLKALGSYLKGEIQWSSDKEFEELKENFAFFQNSGFEDIVCVVDGSEIRVSRPSKEPYQRKHYSGKKKQHSVNIMFICNLAGEILYYSSAIDGAHDQRDWNSLGLQRLFEGKNYGIMGDGGFFFNHKADSVEIKGVKPFTGQDLNDEQKKFNKLLSSMRVVVENSIARVKHWRVIKETYRNHKSWDDKGISLDDVMNVIVPLTNRKIKQNPIRNVNWMNPHIEREISSWLEVPQVQEQQERRQTQQQQMGCDDHRPN
jgi:hypothetical protein